MLRPSMSPRPTDKGSLHLQIRLGLAPGLDLEAVKSFCEKSAPGNGDGSVAFSKTAGKDPVFEAAFASPDVELLWARLEHALFPDPLVGGGALSASAIVVRTERQGWEDYALLRSHADPARPKPHAIRPRF